MAHTPLDLYLSPTADRAPARARLLRECGADGAFTFDDGHDPFLPLAAAAGSELDLMTNVAIAFPRSPMVLASVANDLQLLSGGRFRLGLGSQVKTHIENRFGAVWGQPVEHMREWIEALRAIFASWNDGAALDYRGEYTRHTLSSPAFNPGPNPFGPPKLLVGALGPRMHTMAAEVCDGVLVMPFNSAAHMRTRTIPAIERGLANAGRQRADYEVAVGVVVGAGRTDQELEQARAIKFTIGFYASTPAYQAVLESEGWGDLQPELRALTKSGRWAEIPNLVTDEMMQRLAVWGTPAECARTIAERYCADADRVVANFSGYPIADDTVAEFVTELRRATTAPTGV